MVVLKTYRFRRPGPANWDKTNQWLAVRAQPKPVLPRTDSNYHMKCDLAKTGDGKKFVNWTSHEEWLKSKAVPRKLRPPQRNPIGRYNRPGRIDTKVLQAFVEKHAKPLAPAPPETDYVGPYRNDKKLGKKTFGKWYENVDKAMKRVAKRGPPKLPKRPRKPLAVLMGRVSMLAEPISRMAQPQPRAVDWTISNAALRHYPSEATERLAKPRQPLPEEPPKPSKRQTKEGMDRVAALAKPLQKPEYAQSYPEYVSVPQGALNYVPSERIIQLSKPLPSKFNDSPPVNATSGVKMVTVTERIMELSKPLHPVTYFANRPDPEPCPTPNAMHYEASPHILGLAKPARGEDVANNWPPDGRPIAPSVLSYVASPRIQQLSQPKYLNDSPNENFNMKRPIQVPLTTEERSQANRKKKKKNRAEPEQGEEVDKKKRGRETPPEGANLNRAKKPARPVLIADGPNGDDGSKSKNNKTLNAKNPKSAAGKNGGKGGGATGSSKGGSKGGSKSSAKGGSRANQSGIGPRRESVNKPTLKKDYNM